MKNIILKEIRSFFCWIGIPLMAIAAAYYAHDIHLRSFAANWRQQLSAADGGIYTVRYSNLGYDYILLRLYRTSDGELLAERTYHHPLPFQLIWSKGEVMYSTNDNSLIHDGNISLPPTRMDFFLSSFP